jgi:hypothetical protein
MLRDSMGAEGPTGPEDMEGRMDLNDYQREATAHHEAGHGVFHVLVGHRFRYITLRPRDKNLAGHVVSDQLSDPRKWRAEVAALFAGLIAEDLWWEHLGSVTDREPRRRHLVQYSASTDILNARDELRYVLGARRSEPTCLPMVNPEWTVREMAISAWRHAVLEVASNADAVDWLAAMLMTSSRAVTWNQARTAVTGSNPIEVSESDPAIAHMLYPWFLDYSESELDWSDRDYAHVAATAEPMAARNTQGE